MSLEAEYEKLIISGKVKNDDAQRRILTKLERLQNVLEQRFSTDRRMLRRIFQFSTKNLGIRGLYIYGAVGRGKSMLMDLFFITLNVSKKKRIHFHSFMIDIHARLHAWRNENRHNIHASDPIPILAKDIAKQINVLCFDEFHVSDIADAMILGRLFAEFLKNGIVVVATSNRHPDELYKDGLQRERFLPFISMLKENLEILGLDAQEDYRLVQLKSLDKVYYYPLDSGAINFMEKAFANLTLGAIPKTFAIDILGRKLIIPKTHGDIAWISFSDLCEKPLYASDYIEIACTFGTLLLEGIPQMTIENRNEAKRFVTLIDALYEHKVKLIATAAVSPGLLYVAGHGSAEFERTVSRLMEMQSDQYMVAKHLAYKKKNY